MNLAYRRFRDLRRKRRMAGAVAGTAACAVLFAAAAPALLDRQGSPLRVTVAGPNEETGPPADGSGAEPAAQGPALPTVDLPRRAVSPTGSQLWVMEADGTHQGPVSDRLDQGFPEGPAWAPDGSRIAFHVTGEFTSQGVQRNIFVVNPDGTGLRQLTTDGTSSEPSWSPDGSQLVFASTAAGSSDLHVMDIDGGRRTRITTGPESESAPAWSPDGTRIAFSHQTMTRSTTRTTDRIGVVDADGTARTILPGTRRDGFDVHDRNPAWSPDGTELVFDSYPHEDLGRITRADADGSKRRAVTDGNRTDQDPAWSPSGNRVVFTTTFDFATDRPGIYVTNTDGSTMTRLTSDPTDRTAAWSPDGTRIAFFRGKP